MYDTSFDHTGPEVRDRDRMVLWALRIAALVGIIAAASAADAQMPSSPVLQNVWATPGIVGAINVAGGSDGSVYAAAGAWTPSSGRFQLSGGLGYQTRTGLGSGAAYGVRVALPLGGASSAIGFAAFAGIGGGTGGTTSSTMPETDTTASTAQIPVGASVGWRQAIGSNHGVSLYVTPSYVFFTGGSNSTGLFRAAIGADVGITSTLGATVGFEFGGTRARAFGGPTGTRYGVGVSYALGRR